ncbi:MAG: amino acid adenylation domain-containing protein, partial [bacterium]|nr:amino acid adenylation domain-containing protein [bacterium]
EEQVERTPGSIAVASAGSVQMTYRQLNEISHRVAAHLMEKGGGINTITGIMMERSLEMVIGIMGILKTGAACLPIDPGYPKKRIRYMLRDSGAGVILVSGDAPRLGPLLPARGRAPVSRRKLADARFIDLMEIIGTGYSTLERNNHGVSSSLNSPVKGTGYSAERLAGRPAYIIYTPGITGKPNGVVVEHTSLVNVLFTLHEKYPLSPGDSYLLKTSFVSDVFFSEVFGWFMGGGRLTALEKEGEKDPRTVLEVVKALKITHINFGPTAFNVFLGQLTPENAGQLAGLRYIFLAGEAVSPELVKKFNRLGVDAKLENLYGSTEATVYASLYSSRDWDGSGAVPIGKPLPNVQLYILNRYNNLQPIGIAGELCIAGSGVARGYLNRPELTKKKFEVRSSHFALNSILYHTGDLVRWLPDGNIEFLGRIGQRDDPIEETPSAKVAPRDEIEEKLAIIWSELLYPTISLSDLGIDDNFFEVGGHSLKVTFLIVKIKKELDVDVPMVEILKAPFIRQLAEYIKGAANEKYMAIQPVEKMEYYPLSSAQKRLYLLHWMESESTAYNIPLSMVLQGEHQRRELEEAFKKLILRHESLRTSFHMVNHQPVQKVHDDVDFKMELFGKGDPLWSPSHGNMDSNKGSHRGLPLQPLRNFVRPFDLSRAPLMRAGVTRADKGRFTLMVDIHHIVSDGVSQGVLEKDFMALYSGETLQPLPLQYKDFSRWQEDQRQKESFQKQQTYWLEQFDTHTGEELPVLALPLDYPRPRVQRYEGHTVSFRIPGETTRKLNAVVSETGSTLFMVLLSISSILLSKLCGQEDIVIGTPVAGRRHADLEKIIGMFVNTLALRNYPRGEISVEGFLKQVKGRTLGAFEHQEYPFEDLVDIAGITRDASRNPVFDVMISLDHFDRGKQPEIALAGGKRQTVPALKSRVNDDGHRTVKFDLSFGFIETGEQIKANLDYSTHLFKRETIERMVGYFQRVAAVAFDNLSLKLHQIRIMSEEERKQLLVDFNNTGRAYPGDKTIHELFEETAVKQPYHIAVVYEDRQLTYGQLDQRSNHLAAYLHDRGVREGHSVGIMAGPSLELVTGVLSILKAGAAYLPINPDFPKERVDFMMRDSAAKIIITKDLMVDGLDGWMVKKLDGSGRSTDKPTNLAYITYTSGSTGKPKGVMVEHRNLIAYLNAFYYEFDVTADDTFLQQASLSFDVFAEEVFSILLRGGKSLIASRDVILDSERLSRFLIERAVTIISCSPLLLNEINKWFDTGSLRIIVSGGDVLKKEYVSNLVKQAKVYNGYGPTEATIGATWYLCSHDDPGEPSIGKPMANYTAYILDSYRRLLPVGIAGELYVGGDGVARGYLNRPELTGEKFIRDFWGDRDIKRETGSNKLSFGVSGRLYRTGDLAYWLEDGNIEFLGRIDHQVKIRGYRIELGEIENWLLKRPEVRDAIVMTRGDDSGIKYMCAYFTTTEGDGDIEEAEEHFISELREYLLKNVPEYMVPSYFVEIDRIPLTSNGKVDRKALPAPQLKAGGDHIAPAGAVEIQLARIWADVLGVGQSIIGIDSNFFELGGHSLKATVMVSKVLTELEVRVPLVQVFQTPDIRQLAEYIKGAGNEKFMAVQPVEKMEYYPLSSAQKRLYLFHRIESESTVYNIPLFIPLNGEPHRQRLEQAFKELILRHESLRTSFHVVNHQQVQKVHDHVEFKIEFFGRGDPPWSPSHGNMDSNKGSHRGLALQPLRYFVRPFDLSRAPLM